jgi:hypothetical protein
MCRHQPKLLVLLQQTRIKSLLFVSLSSSGSIVVGKVFLTEFVDDWMMMRVKIENLSVNVQISDLISSAADAAGALILKSEANFLGLPWHFSAIFALAANDADPKFAAQALLYLKQTVEFMRTMHSSASYAGTFTAAHPLPERILPMVVQLLAHHPDFVRPTTFDAAERTSFAKITIEFVMEALVTGPE